MTHLYIEQNTGLTEEVNSSIISKLYELAISGDLDNTSDLKGRLHSTLAYRAQIEYLNTTFPDLHISADNFAVPFEDPNMLQYLLDKGIGSNGIITESQATAVTSVSNASNTTITKFNEFKYFTNITESKGGFSGVLDGNMYFYGWTALEEIDISNLTSIGHSNGYSWGDTFVGCTSLKKVIASDKLTKLGYNAFNGCSNLDTIIGLEGTIEVWDYAFYDCSQLPQSFFQPLSFILKGVSNDPSTFANCVLLESINIAEGTTSIPIKCFWGCSNLQTITLPSTCNTIKNSSFRGCTKLMALDSQYITNIEYHAFNGNTSLTTVNVPNLTSIGYDAFTGCTNLQTFVGLANLTTLPNNLFNNCSKLSSIDVDFSNITNIGSNVFSNCDSLVINTLSIPNLIELGQFAFAYGTQVSSVANLGAITILNAQVFRECNTLTSVVIPNTVTYIKNHVFYQCTNLTTVNIPSSCKSIDTEAFCGCSNLDITVDLSNVTQMATRCFAACTKLKISNFPKASIYPTQCFLENQSIISVTIPKEVTELGVSCFQSCNFLQTLSFEQGAQITTIKDMAFYRCWALQSIILPEGLNSIGAQAFRECNGAYTVDIPSTVTELGNAAFYGVGGEDNFAYSTIVIFRGSTPPTCSSTGYNLFARSNSSQLSTLTIYVPDAAVNTYKSQTYLSYYSDRIFGLSQLPNS